MTATSASQRIDSSPAFLNSPLRRFENVTCLLFTFSIFLISILPLPIFVLFFFFLSAVFPNRLHPDEEQHGSIVCKTYANPLQGKAISIGICSYWNYIWVQRNRPSDQDRVYLRKSQLVCVTIKGKLQDTWNLPQLEFVNF